MSEFDGLLFYPIVPPAPTHAYSVRLLDSSMGVSSYTGPCMRVRRASDSVEADVGFNASNEFSLTSPISNTSDGLSYTDFADFVDHTGTPTDGFVRLWYDQMNSKDFGQPTAGNQWQIYDATTGILEEGPVGNLNPILQPTQSSFASMDIATSTSFDHVYMAAVLPSVNEGQAIQGANSGEWFFRYTSGSNSAFSTSSPTYKIDGVDEGSLTQLNLRTNYQNVHALYSIDKGASNINLGRLGIAYINWKGFEMQEVLVYPALTASEQTAVRNNVNTYFGI